jgi:predicted DNA-binding transcriptional regulator AlpA
MELDRKKLIPFEEACERLGGVCRGTIYNWLRTPGFPQRVYIGRSVFFVEAEIDAYIGARMAEREKQSRAGGRRKAA